MSISRSLVKTFHALWLCLAGIGLAAAQANSIVGFEVAQQGGAVVVRITTKEPLKSVPPNFAIASPARLAFDFAGTANGLGRNSQEIGQGDLRSMNVVQGAGRTRLVLNLARSVGHEARLDGNALLVTLQPAAAAASAPSSQVAHFAEGRADAKHTVRDIDFRRGRAGEGRIVVDLADSSTGIDIRQQGQNIIVEFLKTSLPDNLRRRLDVVDFATPVQIINTFQQGENVRMVIEPRGQWEHNAYQSDTQFVIEVKPLSADGSQTARKGVFTGEKLSLNFQNVEVRAVLNVIADFTDFNIVTSDSVGGSITLRLKDVPWDQALDIILQARGLDMRKTGNVIWIAPRDELATREKLAMETRNQINDLEPLQTEVFQLNYHKADAFVKLLTDDKQRILSKRGSAVIDPRSNKIFVQDVPSRLEDIRRVIQGVDVPVRQVMIEARIVEASDGFSRNLGVRLGWNDTRLAGSQAPDNDSGRFVVGERRGAPTPVTSSNTTFINVPAAGLNSFASGALQLTLFSNSLTRFLNIELSALEADGKGKIISSPRVLTADQVEAVIEQGTEIPYQQASSSGATTTGFRKANLALKVKPQITPDGNVIMSLDVNKDQPGTITPAGVQINTKHVKTEVLVENGGTVVIGGIYEQTERSDLTQVPFLGDLPYVGFLFRNRQVATQKTELLVFITPRIVNERLTVR